MSAFVQTPYSRMENTFCPQAEDPPQSLVLIISHRESKQSVQLICLGEDNEGEMKDKKK